VGRIRNLPTKKTAYFGRDLHFQRLIVDV